MFAKNHQLPDLPQRKSERLHPPNEANPLQIKSSLETKTFGAAWSFGEQRAFLVEADAIGRHPRPSRQFANAHRLGHARMGIRHHIQILQSGVKSRVKSKCSRCCRFTTGSTGAARGSSEQTFRPAERKSTLRVTEAQGPASHNKERSQLNVGYRLAQIDIGTSK